MAEDHSLWWHTLLAAVGAILLFIPLVFVAGVFVWIQDMITQGYIGRTGEGIGFLMRGVQFGLASWGAIIVPSLLLKRTNLVVVASIAGTIFTIVMVVGVLIGLARGDQGKGLFEWLEVIATTLGVVIGAIAAAGSATAQRRRA